MKLIDADEAHRALSKEAAHRINHSDGKPFSVGQANGIILARDIMKQIPAVDAAPIVRCGECCFGRKPISADMREGYMYCKLQCKYKDIDAFCSEGEPRDARDDG